MPAAGNWPTICAAGWRASRSLPGGWSMAERLVRWVKKEPKLAGAVASRGPRPSTLALVLVSHEQAKTARSKRRPMKAQRERALDQVNVLLDANPQAVSEHHRWVGAVSRYRQSSSA